VGGVIVLGVDPGARSTGLVLRKGDELLAHTIAERKGDDLLPTAEYLAEVIAAANQLGDFHVVGAESVQKPNVWHGGKKQVLDPTAAIGTGMVLAAVLLTWPATVVVPPSRNGKAPRQLYPEALWGEREGDAGTGKLRHCRSAWDVAGAAVKHMRIGTLARPLHVRLGEKA
jgi:hypothetical protein